MQPFPGSGSPGYPSPLFPSWRVHNIKVDNESQCAESFRHSIPGKRFRKGGIMSDLRLATCQPAMNFVMEVEYVGALAEGEVFEAALVGTAML